MPEFWDPEPQPRGWSLSWDVVKAEGDGLAQGRTAPGQCGWSAGGGGWGLGCVWRTSRALG